MPGDANPDTAVKLARSAVASVASLASTYLSIVTSVHRCLRFTFNDLEQKTNRTAGACLISDAWAALK
jgi:hypothetical protein